jgi:Fe-Mn family superoxide dismutase
MNLDASSSLSFPMISRRQALKSTFGAALLLGSGLGTRSLFAQTASGPHTQEPLGYAYNALEPFIDAQTMEIHFSRHHAGYIANLNRALADYPDLQKWSIEELLKNLDKVPERIRTTVRNNAGGHYNHALFWKSLKKDQWGEPGPRLGEALGELFEGREDGEEKTMKAGLGVFGSGWVWLSVDANKKLVLETTPNQDNPLMFGRKPLVGIDVWEHAYYLKYQNRRADYLKACMSCINWSFLDKRFAELTA